jgi:hypothetical protein
MRVKKTILFCCIVTFVLSFFSPSVFAICDGAYYSVSCFPTASYGSAGTQVKVIQLFLCAYNYEYATNIFSSGGIDGLFGNTTKLVVKSFQSESGLYDSGTVNSDTWSQIRNFTYEYTTQFPTDTNLTHEGDYKTNYGCYLTSYLIWKYRHLSEDYCHFYLYDGSNQDEFYYIQWSCQDFFNMEVQASI